MSDVTFVVRAGLAAIMLLGASWSDIWTRRVRNTYWLPFLAFALAFMVGDVALDRQGGGARLLVAVASCAAFYGLWWIGVLFGGADAKGLMVLALLLPGYGQGMTGIIRDPAGTGFTPAIDTLVHGVVLVALLPVWFLLVNLLRGRFGGWATLLALPMPLDEAQERFVWPMQRATGSGVRWKYWQGRDEDLDQVYHDLRHAGAKEVWATPKIPFMIPLAIGFLLALWRGNLLLQGMQALVP